MIMACTCILPVQRLSSTMDLSFQVLFQLIHGIPFIFFLISFLYSVESHVLKSPEYCFDNLGPGSRCGNVFYPLKYLPESQNSCGYLNFQINCSDSGAIQYISISNHNYSIQLTTFREKTKTALTIQIVDMEVKEEECVQPKYNFSFPPSPSWVNYYLVYNQTKTIFYNCSSVPVYAKQHLDCSQDFYKTTNTSPSYSFHKIPKGFDWYGKCTQNVVAPVQPFRDPRTFEIGWTVTGWCEVCEGSGGQCWSNSTASGCACKNGKSYNRTCAPPESVTHRRIKIIMEVFAGCGGLFLLVVLLVYTRNKIWMNNHKNTIDVKAFLESYGCPALQRYTYSDIKTMTNYFMKKIGEGGYGQVFKGRLRDGRLVAVKLLNKSRSDGEDFINEVATIGRTNHVNVVTLMGFCIEGRKIALVYEFMPNGSLERFIYTDKESTAKHPLGWEKLHQIALGIARGLEYLHRGCNTRILHFDIKPHNILLDRDFTPKISDFGLAKLYPTRETVVSTVGARGTMGYIAPELCSRTFGDVSHKSDVYSYGMMMLEMIGGRKNIDPTVEKISEIYFPIWIYNHLKRNTEGEDVEEIQSAEVFEDEKAKMMIIVALWCIQAHPKDRPSMSKVVVMLEGTIQELQMPPNPSVDPRSESSH